MMPQLRISISFLVATLLLCSTLIHLATGFLPTTAVAPRTQPNVLSFPSQSTVLPTRPRTTVMCLSMSLKPAAIPMMDSGKALARSGELLVDLTTTLDIYGGALSAAGAQIRNSGDCIAQAAASCRFKTGAELVCDELREGASCLVEATSKLRQAIEEAELDQNVALAQELATSVIHADACATTLEAAGAGIMQRKPLTEIGVRLAQCGQSMKDLAVSIGALAPTFQEAKDCSQRMTFAADRMIFAGTELQGTTETPKKGGKSWLKKQG